VTGSALAPYQTAIIRIGFAATWLLFLLREWPHREELYGPDGPWSWQLARQLIASNHAFSVLMWSGSDGWFELVYVLAILSSAALALGWRTRTASVLFMIGVLGLQNRSVFEGDGGDNVIHLMSMYLVFTRCGQVWSLDARRRRREREREGPREEERARVPRQGLDEWEHGREQDRQRGGQPEREPARGSGGDAVGVVLWCVLGAILIGTTIAGGMSAGWTAFFWALWAVHALWWAVVRYTPRSEGRAVCDILANLAHNGALLVIVVEVCFIYSTAGWYKIQGTRWQDGTAVYYPMHLDYFSPWPELSGLLVGSGLLTLLVTYGTVAAQVAFPFTLFNRRVKNVLLAVMITEHLSIAVLLGLPFFSLAMITADAVFLPTAALLWLGARASGAGGRLRSALGGGSGRTRAGATAADVVAPGAAGGAPRRRTRDDASVR
jgi:hypothetical protein